MKITVGGGTVERQLAGGALGLYVPGLRGMGLGAVSEPMPPYVGAAINEHGQVFYRVLQDQAAAAAMALNNYRVDQTVAPTPGKLQGTRTPAPPGDLAEQAFAARGQGALAVVGDVMADQAVEVLYGTSLPALQTLAGARQFWVLVEPEQGWQPGADPMRELVLKTRRAIVGLSWGTIAGALAGLGLVAVLSRRRR